MTTTIRYVHTNIVAKDWRALADFYCRVFACEPVLPERNLQGEWLARLTGIEGVTIQGIHLRLPGFGARRCGHWRTGASGLRRPWHIDGCLYA